MANPRLAIGATVKQQQKLQSALLKTASNVTTQGTNDGAALPRGKDGQTK